MELGEKLRQARLTAGLSQRQLCGEEITRNMLSQIETGSARPSMKTLQYLAGRLGKSVSFFLEEIPSVSPNVEVMASARRLYDAGDPAGAALVLEGYQTPDAIFDREKALLQALCRLDMAEKALTEGREGYARSLLEQTQTEGVYCAKALERRRLLLLGRIQKVQLPSLDEELIVRAEAALEEGKPERASQLLGAVEDQTGSQFFFLQGRAYLGEKDYLSAEKCLHTAEASYPQAAGLLEICYREMGDYKRAYEYACKRRK